MAGWDTRGNQVEGSAVQSASRTLLEQVRFDRDKITSAGWDSYPILRFTQAPEVAVHIVDAPGEAEVGAGEIAQGPVAGSYAPSPASATAPALLPRAGITWIW